MATSGKNVISNTTLFPDSTVNEITIGDGINSFGTYDGNTETVINTAISAIKEGGKIKFLDGVWNISSGIDIPKSDLTIEGFGYKTFLNFNNSILRNYGSRNLFSKLELDVPIEFQGKPYGTALTWNTEIVENSGNIFDQASIAVDSTGSPHIVYHDTSTGYFKYAKLNTNHQWTLSNIDTAANNPGTYNAIAVDSNNKLHVAYYAGTPQDLYYATNATGVWIKTAIDTTGNVGKDPSIVLDHNDKVHISYADTTASHLKYATNATGVWVVSTIDSSAGVGTQSSIKIDSNNHPHISYTDATNYSIKYITNVTGAWVAATIDTGTLPAGMQYSSIGVDNDDKIHIGYIDTTSSTLKYATNKTGVWVISTLFTSVGIKSSNLWLDTNNRAFISFANASSGDLSIATNSSGSWVTTTIDSNSAWITSLALDDNGNIYIAYIDDTNNYLRYATSQWATLTIDNSGGDVGKFSSIALDLEGKLHIVYSDNGNNLYYATNKTGVWVKVVIDGMLTAYSSQSGLNNSIVVDKNNNLHVATYDPLATVVRYGTNSTGSWVFSNVSTASNTITKIGIAVDSNSKAHLTWVDTNTLEYATNATGAWVISNLENPKPSLYSSIAVDKNDKVHIAYYNGGNQALNYGNNIGGSFSFTMIDHPGGGQDAGEYNSIAIDDYGNAHISYYHTTLSMLKYATNVGGSWNTYLADSINIASQYSSIAVDADSRIYISYYDTVNKNLLFLTNKGNASSATFNSMIVDSTGDVGQYSSIALDTNNNAYISYYDLTNSNLKYATNVDFCSQNNLLIAVDLPNTLALSHGNTII